MFDVTKGNKAVLDQVEEGTDAFAALFDDLSPRKQLVIITKMNQLLSDEDVLKSLAQATDGAPAKALSSGSTPTPVESTGLDDRTALEHLWNSSTLDGGVQNALKRLLAPTGDRGRIDVEPDGTPRMVQMLTKQVTDLTKELDNERNENHNGSLAAQLKDVKQKLTDEKDDSKSDSLAGKLKAANEKLARAQQSGDTPTPATPTRPVPTPPRRGMRDALKDGVKSGRDAVRGTQS